jgi:hypothetical protein
LPKEKYLEEAATKSLKNLLLSKLNLKLARFQLHSTSALKCKYNQLLTLKLKQCSGRKELKVP